MLEAAAQKQGEDAGDSDHVEEPLATSAADQAGLSILIMLQS